MINEIMINEEKKLFTFLNEWQLLFSDEKVSDTKIQNYCITGSLSNSHVRSLAWRIILKVLPLKRSEWINTLRKLRDNYEKLGEKFNFDPRTKLVVDSDANNPNIVNPLCLSGTNPWCQYFQDRKLRELIDKDVQRTSPDIQFFQSKSIRELMVNILFTYSKCHPQMSYRQGMHELLAPIVFVLDLDQKMYLHLKEQNSLCYSSQAGFSYEDIHLIQAINDQSFLEHDAYAIFCKLMELIKDFYLNEDGNNLIDFRSRAATIFKDHLSHIPFSEGQISNDHILSAIHRRLECIHDELLLTIDPPLARHLSSLQILPQIYGIRWLRLLFGREFTILDLLTIWDVIFADQSSQSMVNYVFVALLVQIRQLLLHADYMTCMHYLLKYPPIQDVNIFIRFVLYLKYPQKYPIPDAMSSFAQYVNPQRSSSRTEWLWAKNNVTPPLKGELARHQSNINIRALDNVLNKIGRQALSAYPADFRSFRRKEKTSVSEESSNGRNSQAMNTAEDKRNNSQTTKISTLHLESSREIELMQEQISLLQSRLNDVDFIGQISARKIRGCAQEKRMMTPEERQKLIEELNEIAQELTRSTISEQYIMQNIQPLQAVPNSARAEAVEMASEVLGFNAASSSATMAAAPITRPRLSSKTLPNANNEMIELRFDKKKNF